MLTDEEIKSKTTSALPNKTLRALAAATAVLAVSGTSIWLAGGPAERENTAAPAVAKQGSPSSADPWHAPTEKFQPGDPSTWTLPISQYQVNSNEVNAALLGAARSASAADCLKGFGVAAPFDVPASYEDVKPEPKAGPRNAMDGRYGDHDLAKVSQYGYGWPEAAAQSARIASSPTVRDLTATAELALYGPHGRRGAATSAGIGKSLDAPKIDGKAVPEYGCAGESQRALTGLKGGVTAADTAEDAIDKLERRAWDGMHTDPRTLAVFAKWSTCMKDKGFDYKNPWDANDDPKWAPSAGRSSEAIVAAVADVECRAQFKVTETMFEVESDWQRRLMKENPKTVAEAKQYTERVMSNVRSTLAR
ncbi:hypothetical protein ACWGI0_07290 [Streptomyces sp. NPDC054802]